MSECFSEDCSDTGFVFRNVITYFWTIWGVFILGEFVVERFLDFHAIQFCLIIVRMKSNKFFSWKKTNHRYSTNYHQLIEIF